MKDYLVRAITKTGNIRGLACISTRLAADAGKFDVAGALGRAGFLTVTKDLMMKEPYRGIVQLHTGEIAEDLRESTGIEMR